jgi:hypothetical protein
MLTQRIGTSRARRPYITASFAEAAAGADARGHRRQHAIPSALATISFDSVVLAWPRAWRQRRPPAGRHDP